MNTATLRIFIPCCLSALLFAACGTGTDVPLQTTGAQKIQVIGHGGSGYGGFFQTVPINTLLSIQQGIEVLGADGVETDVQMSQDGKLVLFHDRLLEESTSCEGEAHHMKLVELLACEYNSLMQELSGSQQKITALENVLQLFSTYESKPLLTLDLKLLYNGEQVNAYLERFANELIRLAEKYRYEDRLLIESSSTSMLQLLKSKNSQLKLFVYPADAESGLATAQQLGLYGITIHNEKISGEKATKVKKAGFHLTIWGVGSAKEQQNAVSKQPDFIQTEDIKGLKQMLNP